VESQLLFYIRNNQGPLRAAIYGGVADTVANNDANIDNLGRLIVLPSLFNGGHRHMAQLYQNSMAIVRQYLTRTLRLALNTFYHDFPRNATWKKKEKQWALRT
jgi:hypothetical protein